MEGDWEPPSALQFCTRSQLKFPSSSGERERGGLEGGEVRPLQNPPPPLSLESFSSAVEDAAKAKAAAVKAQVRLLLSIAAEV